MNQEFEILVVEDSEDQIKLLRRLLGDYKATFVETAEEASHALEDRGHQFDLILMDINLPQRNGYSLLGEIQADLNARNIPVMCISGRSDVTDKLTAFSLGADDYVTKPFDPLELRARIDSRLKKSLRNQLEIQQIVVGVLHIDLARHRVAIHHQDHVQEILVSQTEFKILKCLARRPEQVFTRDQLLVAAWGEDARVYDRVVDAHICTLRKKMGHYAESIKSVSGLGYKLVSSKLLKGKG